MQIDLAVESERVVRKALKITDEKYDEAVAAWKAGIGTPREIERWQIAVETAQTVFEALGAKP